MLPSTCKVLSIQLLHSCCAQLDCWGRESCQPRGVWRNRLCFYLQVKYYLYSSSILVALNWFAEAENHPSPEECGGIDYASIYRYYTASVFRIFWKIMLKGQCHEIFDFRFFSWFSFPQAPEYTVRAILNFPKICDDVRSQGAPLVSLTLVTMEKFFNQENVNYFVWTPLGSRVNKYINFCLEVHFKVSAAWYCPHYLPPVSTTPVLPYQWQNLHRCVVDTSGAPWLANISSNFRKYSKWP